MYRGGLGTGAALVADEARMAPRRRLVDVLLQLDARGNAARVRQDNGASCGAAKHVANIDSRDVDRDTVVCGCWREQHVIRRQKTADAK
jgi:hypothetical protein